MEKSDLLKALEPFKLTMECTFIPASISGRKEQLSFKCIIKRNDRATLEVPIFSSGIAHHPKWKDVSKGKTSYEKREIERVCYDSCQTGKYPEGIRVETTHSGHIRTYGKTLPLPGPSIDTVLYSLLADTSGDLSSFKSFCDDFGYDTDSITALETFNSCRDEFMKLHGMFSSAEIEQLRDLFQDY